MGVRERQVPGSIKKKAHFSKSSKAKQVCNSKSKTVKKKMFLTTAFKVRKKSAGHWSWGYIIESEVLSSLSSKKEY